MNFLLSAGTSNRAAQEMFYKPVLLADLHTFRYGTVCVIAACLKPSTQTVKQANCSVRRRSWLAACGS